MEDITSVGVSYPYSTTLKGQQIPYSIVFSFNKTLDITEEYLAFIKHAILVRNSSNQEIDYTISFKTYEYDTRYYQLKGDATLIYQGLNPPNSYLTTIRQDSAFLNGEFLEVNTSKWYFGTFSYNNGNQRDFRNSRIAYAESYYNVEPIPGYSSFFTYECFQVTAIDNISSTSLSGTGTHTIVTNLADPFDPPIFNTVITKNVTMTVPMFEDIANIQMSSAYYVNNVLTLNYTLNNTAMIRWNRADLSLSGFVYRPIISEYNVLSSFNINVSFTFSFNWDKKERNLFYDSLRAKILIVNTSLYTFSSLPTKSLYQTNTLPYTKLYFKVNPDGYPTIIEDTTTNEVFNSNNHIWTKIDDNKFTFRCNGQIYLNAPAETETTTSVPTVNEIYSQNTTTYVRDAINRPGKNMPIYFPQLEEIQTRLILSLNSPRTYHTEKGRSI
jgi:hypothetical protein